MRILTGTSLLISALFTLAHGAECPSHLSVDQVNTARGLVEDAWRARYPDRTAEPEITVHEHSPFHDLAMFDVSATDGDKSLQYLVAVRRRHLGAARLSLLTRALTKAEVDAAEALRQDIAAKYPSKKVGRVMIKAIRPSTRTFLAAVEIQRSARGAKWLEYFRVVYLGEGHYAFTATGMQL